MAKVVRYGEPLAVVTGGAVLVLWIRALALQIPNYNYSDTFGPTLVELGQLTLVPDSAVTWFYSGAQMVLPRLIAFACSLLGVTPEFMHTAIELVTVSAGLLGLAVVAARIAGTQWAGALAIIAIPFAWPFTLNVGYGAPFWIGYTTAGYWGLGWTCAVWGLWFVSAPTGIGALLPFALAGVEFLAHPTWAIVTLSVLGLGELFEIVAAPQRAIALRVSAIKIGLALLIASPQIAMIVGNLRQPVRPEDVVGFWPLIQFRKSFHYYIWDAVTYVRLAGASLLIVLSTAAVWPLLDGPRRRRAVATILAVAALVAIAYLAMEQLTIKSIASLVLTRSVSLILAMSVVFVAAAATAVLTTANTRQGLATLAAWIALVAMTIPVETAFYAPLAQAFSLKAPDTVRAIGPFALSFMITTVALIVMLVTRQRSTARHPAVLPILCAAVIVVLTAIKLPLIPAFQGAALPTATWVGVTDYLRERTPADALVVMPPYPYSIASARRSYVTDYSLIGAAVYNPPMTAFELNALRNLYGIDLTGMSHDDIKAFLAKNDGILCLLERRYRELVASETRLRSLKAAYPSASFVVGFKPGVTPLEWSCGAYDGPVVPMPIAYENDEYVIYDLRGGDHKPVGEAP